MSDDFLVALCRSGRPCSSDSLGWAPIPVQFVLVWQQAADLPSRDYMLQMMCPLHEPPSLHEPPGDTCTCHCRENGRNEAQENQPEDADGDADQGKGAEDPFKEVGSDWIVVSLQELSDGGAENVSWKPGTASVSLPFESLIEEEVATDGDMKQSGA